MLLRVELLGQVPHVAEQLEDVIRDRVLRSNESVAEGEGLIEDLNRQGRSGLGWPSWLRRWGAGLANGL